MLYYLVFIVAGYLMGSILFAPLLGRLLKKKDIISGTRDQNPGTANAFQQGGLLCGSLTLAADMGKGMLPVFLCLRLFHTPFGNTLWIPEEMLWGGRPESICNIGLALVLAAPVCGHIFPLYHKFRGGKGIATTFGCLLGYFPNLAPALVLAALFILFSLVIRISPHFYRTIGSYLFSAGIFLVWGDTIGQKIGFLLITVLVCVRMHLSTEERGECKVRLLWMH